MASRPSRRRWSPGRCAPPPGPCAIVPARRSRTSPTASRSATRGTRLGFSTPPTSRRRSARWSPTGRTSRGTRPRSRPSPCRAPATPPGRGRRASSARTSGPTPRATSCRATTRSCARPASWSARRPVWTGALVRYRSDACRTSCKAWTLRKALLWSTRWSRASRASRRRPRSQRRHARCATSCTRSATCGSRTSTTTSARRTRSSFSTPTRPRRGQRPRSPPWVRAGSTGPRSTPTSTTRGRHRRPRTRGCSRPPPSVSSSATRS